MTTAEAANRLGLTARSVARLIKSGVLIANKRGRDYWIDEAEIERYKVKRRKAGRPKQAAPTAAQKEDTMKTFRYEEIAGDQLTATDLHAEAEATPGAAAYRITIYDATGTRAYPETAEALYADGRMGIAWGADATWADVSDVESGIEMWLNDGEAWEAAH